MGIHISIFCGVPISFFVCPPVLVRIIVRPSGVTFANDLQAHSLCESSQELASTVSEISHRKRDAPAAIRG